MMERSLESYTSVIKKLLEMWPTWNPEEFYSDFNELLMQAMKQSFKNSSLVVAGHFYDFTQVCCV